MVNLLHLSDLHFGYDEDATARSQRALALDALVRELGALDKNWRPHILVISGDLTWQGRPAGYTELSEWLREKLFAAAGLTADDCIICPGNHDMDRKKTVGLLKRTGDPDEADEVLRPEALEGVFARPFEVCVKFAESFGIPAPMLHGAPNYLCGVRELRGIQFVCLNSAWFCRDSETDRGQLWLGLPQLQSMPLMNQDDYDTAPVTVAVLHHPQEWFANPELNAYGDRPNTYGYLAARTHAILSGHTHGAIERATRCHDRARLFLGGATYDKHAYRNNCSLIHIDPARRSVTRRPWEFDPRKLKWEWQSPDTYSLRSEGLVRGMPDIARYIAWLRVRTQFIDLHQLKVGPGKVPPPAIDVLYIRLKTAARALRSGEPAASEVLERAGPTPLEEALRSRKLVIEGKPGGGKTTFVRWLAWMLCRPAGPPADFALCGFPLWIRIGQLDQHIHNTLQRRQEGDPTTYEDPRWIPHYLAVQGWDLDEEFFSDKLKAEDTILLLDGLDEAATPARRAGVVRAIQRAAEKHSCHVVVTTRPGAHEGRSTLEGFESASIEDLDDDGIENFLLQWCRWLKHGDEAAAQSYLAELRPAVTVPSLRILARNPFMLTALAVLHLRRNVLPQQRAQLYEQIMDWLGEQAAERHPELSKDERLRRFGSLALAMQEWKGGMRLQIGIDTAAQCIARAGLPAEHASDFLEQAQVDSGIITLRGGEITFWHRSFQEYLAARTLANLPDAKLWQRARKYLYSPEGREVLPLLAGYMAASARERLDDLFKNLTRDAVSQRKLEAKAHAAGVLGNMLADVAPAGYALSGGADTQYARLRDAVMVIFQKGKAKGIGLKTRVAAAEALDQASQSRLRLPGDEDYWVEIPGGTFEIGDPKAFQSLLVKSVRVAGFRIGRFPVTVWEYGRFLDETNYEQPHHWDEQAGHPSRPVVYVTWHDARRYCEWASKKWKIDCKLPAEEQWEFAARGTEGRIYPWGGEDQQPDEYRANFGNPGGAPTPVGMFPDGETPEGVADLAGNVWEWTGSDYDKQNKVLRGASFDVGARNLRAASRVRDGPVYWVDVIGFRCFRE